VALVVGASAARPARSDTLTITFLANITAKPAFDSLIPSFEREFPNITVNVTYAPTLTAQYQITTTELAAGNAPDAFVTWPGCGTPISVCRLAKAGDLASMPKKSWTKRSSSVVLAASKYGVRLYTYSQTVTLEGIWTNDTMFAKLGLKVPQTFAQFLNVCRKAKAAGIIPALLPANNSGVVQQLSANIALNTVYAKDARWGQKLKARKVTFAGTAGWHAALQELVDMNNAGCFEPGPAGTTSDEADTEFGLGQALMLINLTSHKGQIDTVKPQFAYSQHPFPSGNDPRHTVVLANLGLGPSVNVHSSVAKQIAAQTFVDFLARPKRDALYARVTGGLSQYQFLKARLPAYLSSYTPAFRDRRYAVNPVETWWNAAVGKALTDNGTALLTGQKSIDDVLNAMDAAWKLGPQ
jgi:raffinose/stachyose/melibiose transport system substrate-binding protein